MPKLKRVCVFCGSGDGARPEYGEAATALGRLLAEQKIELVYGGAKVGLMGKVADAALRAGGRVYGVIPERLRALEVAHAGLTELFVVDSMHARKMMMAQLADAFVALPGGWGTLEETFEILTWLQLRYHTKPLGLLNTAGFYNHLIAHADHAQSEGLLKPEHRALMLVSDQPATLIEAIETYQLPPAPRWIDRP